MSCRSRINPPPLGTRTAALLLTAVSLVGAEYSSSAQTPLQPAAGRYMIADFDQPGWQTNLKDPFGTWDRDPDDPTQFCRARLVDEPRVGSSGYSLMLDYNVHSPNPAFNGFWMKLPSIRLRDFQALSFAVKGDPDRGFTRRVRLELKDKKHIASYTLDGIQAEWVRMHIPLNVFQGIEKLKTATEFVLVFDDKTVTEPSGAIFLDEVAFESGPS